MSRPASRRTRAGDLVRWVGTSTVIGGPVRVIDLHHPASTHAPGRIVEARDVDGNPVKVRPLRWGSLCDTHDVCCPHERQVDARVSADDPTDWCDQCQVEHRPETAPETARETGR